MLFPQLTNIRLLLHVLPPSLLRIHIRTHAERKGENQKKKKKSTIKTTKTICTQTCYMCACQPFVYNNTFGERILGNVQPLAASAWKAFVMPSFHLVHAFGFVNVSSQEHYPLAMFSQ